MENLKYWIWLTLLFGSGNYRKWEFLSFYGDIKQAYDAVDFGCYEGLNHKYQKNLKNSSLEKVEEIISYCDEKGIKIACFDSAEYPEKLKNIDNPPSVLFYYGSLECVDENITIAIIGARKPSEYSVKLCRNFSDELSNLSTVIISGFALGIDSIAHKTALLKREQTIAVLGCGVDYEYPKENASSKKLFARFGAVVSEYFPGTKPVPEYFRQRNRIISGLSDGIIVVEASNTSGALNTISHALVQGRDIFVVPPADVYNPRYYGQISLLRDGATPIFNHYDIVSNYKSRYIDKLGKFEITDVVKEYKTDKSENLNHKKVVNSNTPIEKEVSKKPAEPKWEEFSDSQTKIVKSIMHSDKSSDELFESLDISVETILSDLTELEIFGHIKLHNKKYTL